MPITDMAYSIRDMSAAADIDTDKKASLISIIVALGQGREIGLGNALLWHIPEDMKRFKELSVGHPVIMGRKTWESLPEKFRPLSERTNIIVTRQTGYEAPGAIVVNSLEDALREARGALGAEEIILMGGAQLYAEALPLVQRLYLTLIDDTKEADAYFPEYESEFPKKVSGDSREWNGLTYRWVTLER
jgi:dihydrofolate reductase